MKVIYLIRRQFVNLCLLSANNVCETLKTTSTTAFRPDYFGKKVAVDLAILVLAEVRPTLHARSKGLSPFGGIVSEPSLP